MLSWGLKCNHKDLGEGRGRCGHRKGKGDGARKADITGMQPQSKDCCQPRATEKAKHSFASGICSTSVLAASGFFRLLTSITTRE